MSETRLEAKIVRIQIERGNAGLFYATSPDLKGLLVAENSAEALETAIPAAITDLYAACGEQVFAIPADERDHTQSFQSWVKVPAAVAQSALDAMKERCPA